MPVRATPRSQAPVERRGRCVSAHENGAQWAPPGPGVRGGLTGSRSVPTGEQPGPEATGHQQTEPRARREGSRSAGRGGLSLGNNRPGEPVERGAPAVCARPSFPDRPPPMPFPSGLLGAVGLEFPGSWSRWICPLRAAAVVGGSLLCSPPLSARARSPDAGGPPVNADEPVSAPLPAGGPFTTAGITCVGGRHERSFRAAALEVGLPHLPARPGHPSRPGPPEGALVSGGREGRVRAQSGPSSRLRATALPTPHTLQEHVTPQTKWPCW